jgi:hypothetical protein
MQEQAEFQFIRKLRVHDIVFSFCYACRNGRYNWPWLLIGPQETRWLRTVSLVNRKPFIDYAVSVCPDMIQLASCIHVLSWELNQLNDAEVNYAVAILQKHYLKNGESNECI